MKKDRREAVLELVAAGGMETQRQLLEALNAMGYAATQATVSRDIRALRIVKAPDSRGVSRYIAPEEPSASRGEVKYGEIFRNSVLNVQTALNDVVIRCHPGMAQGACAALDRMFGNLALGTLAGDDTILAVTADTASAGVLAEKIRELL